jgi:hypothetical protein
MPRRDDGLQNAGERINQSGLGNDAPRIREQDLTDRSSRSRNRTSPRQAADEPDYEADDGDEDGDEDAHARRSNPRDEEDPDDDDDGDVDDDSDVDEDSDGDEDESDEDESSANSLDAEYEVTVNGKKEKVKLQELLQGYQRTSDYHRKTQELAERRRTLDAGHQTVAETYQRRLNITGGVLKTVEQMLVGDINSPAMQDLRQRNPNEWMIVRQEMQDRIGSVQSIIGKLVQEQERHAKEFEDKQKSSIADQIPREMERVGQFVKDWDGEGKKRLGAFLLSSGFSAKELEPVYDSRMLIIAEKARRYDAAQKAKEAANGKRRKPEPVKRKAQAEPAARGRMQRPTGPKGKAKRDFRDARARLRKSGDMRDAGRAIALTIDD